MKNYYWSNALNNHSSDNDLDCDQVIEIKHLNFFIGVNNSGKSRFLRNLFIEEPKSFRKFQKYDIDEHIIKLHKIIENIIHNKIMIKADHQLLFVLKEKINSLSKLKFKYQDFTSNLGEIDKLTRHNNFSYEINNEISIFFKAFELITKKDFFKERYYIPILRGMRPIKNESIKNPYVQRTVNDYFKKDKNIKDDLLITGESLYEELVKHLLGEPEQRQLIRAYENKLSSYFFDNQEISLIPKHGEDVIHIKVGEDKQFPIFQLGDGLQQIIILTYQCFINKEHTHAFFIEEPELHMHAGMLRQLMKFYLHETTHYYFFTTHSNHLLDMIDESDQVIIQKIIKQPKETNPKEFDFKIYRCDRDRTLLASLGVRPSSIYLANCTIWVEGITDRLYIIKYMEKYLEDLKNSNDENDKAVYNNYSRFMINYHYTFVEYAGSNVTHWSFEDDYPEHYENEGLAAKAVSSTMLLVADGDTVSKSGRKEKLQKTLGKNLFILRCKEIENTLPFERIIRIAKQRFSRMQSITTQGSNINKLDDISDNNYFHHKSYGIGKLLDRKIIVDKAKKESIFADGKGVGTIKNKLSFCRETLESFDTDPSWNLTEEAKLICKKIFTHIESNNL